MFIYESIKGIKIEDNVYPIKDLPESYCILLPEFIKDIIKVINYCSILAPYRYYSFVNGYAYIQDKDLNEKFFRKDGACVKCEEKVKKITDDFYCDRAKAILIQDEKLTDGYVDGLTGKAIFPESEDVVEYVNHSFSCDLAVIEITDINGDDYVTYLDKTGKIVTDNKYLKASSFINDSLGNIRALVKTLDLKWQMIDDSFNILMVFDEELDSTLEKLAEQFDNLSKKKNKDSQSGRVIYTLIIIHYLAEKFKITLPCGSIEEQLTYLIGEIAKQGIYVFDIKNMLLKEAEIVDGIQILDKNTSVISFSKEDIALIKERTKEGER